MIPPCSTSTPLTPSSATATPRSPSRLLLLAALLAGCPAPADNSKDDSDDQGSADGGDDAGDGASDGAADGSADGSGDGVAPNQAPSTPTIAFATTDPVTTDDLWVQIVTEAIDPDGAPITYQYRWTQNGAPRADLTGEVVPDAETSRDEVWEVEVIATDGTDAAPGVRAALTVQNSAPTLAPVSLSPEAPLTDDTLTVSAAGSDADGDTLSYSYAWTVNGRPAGDDAPTLSGAAHFSKGDVVQVLATPHDGAVSGTGALSSVLTIQNSAPVAPTVSVSPATPRAGRGLECAATTTDADADPLSYSYSWTVDGVPYPSSSASVPMGETLPGEVWRCSVRAFDGTSYSSTTSRSLTVGATSCSDGAVSLTASGIEFVTVCGQTFDMGCTPGQSSCEADESPVRTTTLTRDFYLSRTEVTQGQFLALMGYNPSVVPSCGASCPAEFVTWHESAAFANALSSAAGLPSCYSCTGSGSTVSCTGPSDPYACTGYRLPTEAEWEGAARCSEDLLYAGSDEIDDIAWHGGNSGSTPHAVGGLQANTCGLSDMSGNVWEWVNDWYTSGAYVGGVATDPSGTASGANRVLRGGGWSSDPQNTRVAVRVDDAPGGRLGNRGIRLARTAP